jgi:hypothetical protein
MQRQGLAILMAEAFVRIGTHLTVVFPRDPRVIGAIWSNLIVRAEPGRNRKPLDSVLVLALSISRM